MSNRKLYWILSLLTVASYVWIGYQLTHTHEHTAGTLCVFKNVTGIPCPSCGVTRSILCILQGDFWGGLYLNPIGLIGLIALLIMPIWLVWDTIRQNNSLIIFYRKVESAIKTQRIIYFPLIGLVLLNWIWNITKEL
jgi:hypothetical protein